MLVDIGQRAIVLLYGFHGNAPPTTATNSPSVGLVFGLFMLALAVHSGYSGKASLLPPSASTVLPLTLN